MPRFDFDTLPPPEDCTTCRRRETWTVAGVERNRCRDGHPMHPGCGYHKSAHVSIINDRRRPRCSPQ